MSIPFNSSVPIADAAGRATRAFIAFLQSVGTGPVARTVNTYAEIAEITPTLGLTVICSDSSVSGIGDVLAGGGTDIVQAIGDGTDWRVI